MIGADDMLEIGAVEFEFVELTELYVGGSNVVSLRRSIGCR